MKTKILEVNGIKRLIKIHFENRGNATASIGKKTINIRLPLSLNREEQFRQLVKLEAWAKKSIEENPEKFNPKPTREYNNGDTLKVGNEDYKLNISFKNKQTSSARIINNIIHLVIPFNLPKEIQSNHISTLLSRCIASKRLQRLKEKVRELNGKHFNQKLNNISFRYNKSNWGSCSRAGNINISTRLLFAPEDILEYVCVHELAHLIEPNHSDRFWTLVEKAMPNYGEKEQFLKENGHKLGF